jgi:hypothetical protein
VLAGILCVGQLALTGCSKSKDPSVIGTFRMGETVQAGPIVYTVLESEWKTALADGSRVPANRFLLLRVSIANSGGQPVSVPGFELRGPGDKAYTEVTQGVESVTDWLGMLRSIPPGGKQQGWVVFDVPMAAYTMVATDDGEVGSEKHALIEIPVHLE